MVMGDMQAVKDEVMEGIGRPDDSTEEGTEGCFKHFP